MTDTLTIRSLRELDAEVAKARGWRDIDLTTEWRTYQFGDPGDDFCEPDVGTGVRPGFNGRWPFPRYTTDANAALELEQEAEDFSVIRYREQGRGYSVNLGFGGEGNKAEHASLLVAVCLAYVQAKTGRRVVLEGV